MVDSERDGAVAATVPATPAARTADPLDLGPGATLGRYCLVRQLGAGGMGVVYVARDPELDRDIALKVVQPATSVSTGGQARLVREAQAMAKLQHANVIAVYDVGVVDGRVFVAMELIDGTTLRAWLEERPPWRAVVERFVAAGRGLAAAHAAGIVHRDFKPENVLLGRDGTVRVGDFGLARPVDDDSEDEVVGTPVYMAPEQHRGVTVTPAADQYAFCVALWEGLVGKRPFQGKSADELSAAKSGGMVIEPRGADVPRWLLAIVRRGLAADPDARHASMTVLVDALERGLARRRRVIAGATVAAVVAASATGAALVGRESATSRAAAPPSPCATAGDAVAAVWSPVRRDALTSAFTAVGKPYAASSAAQITGRLDAWATAWRSASIEACELDGGPDVSGRSPRRVCLERQLDGARALLAVLEKPDESLVQRGPMMAPTVAGVTACASPEMAERTPPPLDHVVARQLEAKYADLQLQPMRGDLAAVRDAARALAAEAEHAKYAVIQAEALAVQGWIEDALGEAEAAKATDLRALELAQATRHDMVLVRAALELVWISRHEGDLEEARRWLRLAAATAARDGREHLASQVAFGEAGVAASEGRYADAVDAYRRAAAMIEKQYGPDDLSMTAPLHNLGIAYEDWGKLDDARAAYQRAHEIRKKHLGNDHPDAVFGPEALARLDIQAKRYDEALAALREVDGVLTRALGENHRRTLLNRDSIAETLRKANRPTEALPLFQATLATRVRVLGPDDPDVARSHGRVGATLYDLGRFAEALVELKDARARREQALGPEHPDLVPILVDIGRSHARLGKKRDARLALQRAVTLAQKHLTADHENRTLAETALADLDY